MIYTNFSVEKRGVDATKPRIMDAKCRSYSSELHCVELGWTQTSSNSVHGSAYSAVCIHLIRIMWSMIELELHLYCTPYKNNGDFLQT